MRKRIGDYSRVVYLLRNGTGEEWKLSVCMCVCVCMLNVHVYVCVCVFLCVRICTCPCKYELFTYDDLELWGNLFLPSLPKRSETLSCSKLTMLSNHDTFYAFFDVCKQCCYPAHPVSFLIPLGSDLMVREAWNQIGEQYAGKIGYDYGSVSVCCVVMWHETCILFIR